MRRVLAVVVGALLAYGCGSESPTAPRVSNAPPPTPQPTATPTPAPTPRADMVGLWKIANTGNLSTLTGYAIDITSHNLATGEVRGRSVYPYRNVTGLLRGTVRGNHIDWRTEYTPSDSENGSMDRTNYINGSMLEGFVLFEYNSFDFSFRFTGVALWREIGG